MKAKRKRFMWTSLTKSDGEPDGKRGGPGTAHAAVEIIAGGRPDFKGGRDFLPESSPTA